jgi:hypothetical protein
VLLPDLLGILDYCHPPTRRRKESHVKQPMRPGTTAPKSGQWGIVGQRGANTGQERTVTKGEPLPPTPKAGQGYVMNDPTKNKAGK